MPPLELSREALIAAIESMTRELRDLKATTMGQVEGLYEEIEKLKTSIAVREIQIDGHRVEYQKQTKEITRLQTELSAMDGRLHSSQLEAMTLASQLEDARREVADKPKKKIIRRKSWLHGYSMGVNNGKFTGFYRGVIEYGLTLDFDADDWEEVDYPGKKEQGPNYGLGCRLG